MDGVLRCFVLLRNKKQVALVAVVVLLLAWYAYVQVRMLQIPEPSLGEPITVGEDVKFPDSKIRQIVHDDNHFYVLYYTSMGYVQVYDPDGTFQYALLFHGPSRNGGFRIAVVDDVLYVLDNMDNLYVLPDGLFQKFIAKDSDTNERDAIYSAVDFSATSATFVVRKGDIWRIENDSELCVVDRPFMAFVLQYDLDWAVMFLVMIIIAIIMHKEHKYKTL